MNIDEFIEHTQETAKKHRYHADFFDINNPMRVACIKSAEDCEQLAEWLEKSKEYQHLEEQDRLVKLPCKVGDIVYKPNSVTLKEIVEIKIESMFITESNFNISGRTTKMKYSFCCTPKDFGKTVFLTKSEVEAKLKRLRGGKDEERS